MLLRNVESFEVNLIDASEKEIEVWPSIETVGTGTPIALRFSIETNEMGTVHRILEIPGGAL